jgi:hypothetical protein
MRGCVVALCGAMLSVAAAAQTTTAAPGPAQRCLTRGEPSLGAPDYPAEAYRLKVGATVKVRLSFAAPDQAPAIESIAAKADARHEGLFERSVRDFVARYRLPCLPAGETTPLAQEFVFVPHDGRPVAMYGMPDPSADRRARLAKCVRHERPGTLPAYPGTLSRADREGNVMLRARFVSADTPPTLEVLDDGGSRYFAESASEYAEGFRLPCHDGNGPVDLLQLYVFRMPGGARLALRDLSLVQLLGSFKGIRQASVYFDFNAMGCPFDVRFGPRQPVLPNEVGEIGDSNPERRFFLDWLTRQQIDVPKQQLNAFIGQYAVVTVPCTVLNLGSASGGGASK